VQVRRDLGCGRMVFRFSAGEGGGLESLSRFACARNGPNRVRLSTAPASPVSLELRHALRTQQRNRIQLNQRLGMTPPVVLRWFSPAHHAHGVNAQRRMAEVLDMDVKVRLVPWRVE
jgi:hypothetical protein